MNKFTELLKTKKIIFDGAMGTEIQKRISNAGTVPEALNITSPEIIRDIHKKYTLAGADVATANTFGANSYKLKNSSYSPEELIRAGIRLAREEVKEEGFVALDIGTIGILIDNDSEYDFNKAYEIYKEQIIAGREAGCDLIVIETMTDLYEAKAAVLAAKENSDLPVICSMTLQEDGKTLTGSDILTICTVLDSLEVDAVGLNCSFGPKEMMPYIKQLCRYSNSEIIIQPNAGLPLIENGNTVFKLTPADYLEMMKKISSLGINILGGCCGTSPEHIRMLSSLKNEPRIERKTQIYTGISSSTRTAVLGSKINIIGETINPTGNLTVKNAISEGDYSYISNVAKQQELAGADIIDINVGVPGIDEKEVVAAVTKKLMKATSLPLQIDSNNPDTIETFLRIYNGRAVVNSVNAKKSEMDNIFPLIKKYGACVIGLTIDENGIPKTCDERVAIAEKIINEAKKYNIGKERIIIDCLALTASAQQSEIMETLKAIEIITKKFGVHTTLGISNVSHGLPAREHLNSVFLISALSRGLDTPIADVFSDEIVNAVRAFRVLTDEDSEASEYINSMTGSHVSISKKSSMDFNLKECIVENLEDMALEQLDLLIKKFDGMEIINSFISPALEEVGKKYKSGEIFLPQMIHSAEIVNKLFVKIKNDSADKNAQESAREKIILATVEGDVHDIGKNIVRMILENYNYHILDLGKDVHHDTIIETALSEKVSLIGLSALMTTTVSNMEKAISNIKKSVPGAKIMVGGAVLSEDYAHDINADYYGRDAMEAVEIAKKHFLDR